MSQIPSGPILSGDETPVEPGTGGVSGAPGVPRPVVVPQDEGSIDWRARALQAEAGLALATQTIEALTAKLAAYERASQGAPALQQSGPALGACMPIANAPSPGALLDEALEAARSNGSRTSILRYLRLRRGV